MVSFFKEKKKKDKMSKLIEKIKEDMLKSRKEKSNSKRRYQSIIL